MSDDRTTAEFVKLLVDLAGHHQYLGNFGTSNWLRSAASRLEAQSITIEKLRAACDRFNAAIIRRNEKIAQLEDEIMACADEIEAYG